MTVAFEKFENLARPLFRRRSIHTCQQISDPTRDSGPLSQEKSCMYPYSLPPLFHAFIVTTEPSALKKLTSNLCEDRKSGMTKLQRSSMIQTKGLMYFTSVIHFSRNSIAYVVLVLLKTLLDCGLYTVQCTQYRVKCTPMSHIHINRFFLTPTTLPTPPPPDIVRQLINQCNHRPISDSFGNFLRRLAFLLASFLLYGLK